MSSSRPYLICHMMTSLDGKITSGTGQDIFDEQYLPLYSQCEDELEAQGWLCGRVTMEMFAEAKNTPLPATHEVRQETYRSSHLLKRFAIAVDTHGTLRWKSNTIRSAIGSQLEYALIVFVTKETPTAYLAYLRSKDISYLTVGVTTVDWPSALEQLSTQFELKKLLVEGGGKLNGSLLKAGLIDELSLLLIPLAVNNSQAPSLFDQIVTPATFQTTDFSLTDVRRLEKDVLWLRYTQKLPL